MAGTSVSDIAFPLSQTEATNHMTDAQRRATTKAPATEIFWWVRSRGSNASNARLVAGTSGLFTISNVTVTGAVRPALWISRLDRFGNHITLIQAYRVFLQPQPKHVVEEHGEIH